MAYKVETQKLIPGGLNFLAPGDQVTPGDCLDLTGWWSGAAGKLEQAPRSQLRNFPSVATTQDSICQTDGRTYYGGGGNLRQIGARDGTTPIESGYDGAPLGMIGYQGSVWIMNRALNMQRRDNGTAPTAWTPAAPGVPALTNPALTSATLTATECDPANPDSTGAWTQINLFTAASVKGIEVGGLVTIFDIAAGTSAAMNGTWQVVGVFEGSSNLIQLQASLPAATVFTVAAGIHFTFAAQGMPLADYYYWITWVYTEFGESNPSSTGGALTIAGGSPAAATISVTAAGTYVLVDAAIPIGAVPAGVSGWNLYRQGNGLGVPYRLNENTLPLSRTSVNDYGDDIHTHSDAQLLSLGILMEGDHDPAPQARVIANQIYNGRIVVANSALNPNRIWYTPALQPGFFRGSGNPTVGDWVDVGTDRGDEIMAMTVRPGLVVIYRSKSIWRHIGDFGDVNARLECVVPDMGTVGYRGVVSTSLGDYYIWNDGVYKYNGDWGQKLSAKVEPLFLGKTLEALPTMDVSRRSECAIGFKNGRLWVSYPAAGSVASGSLVYHVDTARWFSSFSGYRAFLDTGAEFLGAGAGIDALENAIGSGDLLSFRSEYQDCGLPDHEKTWADLVLNHNTHGVTLTITIKTNKGADSFTLRTISSSAMTKQTIPLIYPGSHALAGLPIRSYNLSIGINGGTAGSGPITIDTPILLHYYTEARRAKSFDSDETSHGAQGVKEVDQLEFDVDASDGPATASVYTDIPGGVMTARTGTGVTINQTSGRQVRRLVLTAPVDGNLLRYTVSTTTDCQIYAARARVLPIGVYLSGETGDFWQPSPLSVGT